MEQVNQLDQLDQRVRAGKAVVTVWRIGGFGGLFWPTKAILDSNRSGRGSMPLKVQALEPPRQ